VQHRITQHIELLKAKKALFEIAGALGTPLTFDEASNKKVLCHHTRALIEVNLT